MPRKGLDSMNGYQLFVVVLYILNITVSFLKDGEKKNDRYSFGGSIVNAIIMYFVLKGGGFF